MLKAENLCKNFGNVKAVDDLSFEVEEGEIVGLIGPNGAGKSTTMEMCAGLLQPDSGKVSSESSLKESVGIVFQSLEIETKVTVREFLDLMRRLNDSEMDIDDVIDDVGLKKQDTYVGELSGGQKKKKLNIASALVKDPDYLLLDESAAGLDVQSRTSLEEVIRGLKNECGILLSTHSMDIAERLCDRAVILDEGRKVIEGDIDQLIRDIDAQYVIKGKGKIPSEYEDGAKISGEFFEIFCDRPQEILGDLVESGEMEDIEDLTVNKPGLEEVYLAKTGEKYEESN